MADTTMGSAGAARPSLFLRNATGLVKAWSTFDAFVYSFWSVNLITLGLYGMSFVYTVPDGQVIAAILLFGILTTFLVITYAMLVSVMPRTGGDYAWQSRVLGGGLGMNEGIAALFMALEKCRRGFAAKIAINALLIGIEFAAGIVLPFFCFVGHFARD